MVMKMMKWRPWPPLVTRKYEVKLAVKRLEGWNLVEEGVPEKERLTVEIRWKGPKATLGSLRRTVKRNFTKEAVGECDVVSWEDEEFQSLCSLTSYKDSLFYPWEITFSVFTNGMKQGQKNKAPIVGTAFLNLAEYARVTDKKEIDINIPLTLSACVASEPHPLLFIIPLWGAILTRAGYGEGQHLKFQKTIQPQHWIRIGPKLCYVIL